MSNYVKPQVPLQHKDGDYFYPLTTVDQVIMEDGARLSSRLGNVVSRELLWKNEDLLTSFPAKTISFDEDLNKYDAFLITGISTQSWQGIGWAIAFMEHGFNILWNGSLCRAGWVHDHSIEFYSTVSNGGTNDSEMIPYEIYGIKVGEAIPSASVEGTGVADAVRYATIQNLTEAQKEVARDNIGATSMTLLWENASSTSSFAEQTVSLDLSAYDEVRVDFCLNHGDYNKYILSSKCRVGETVAVSFIWAISGVTYSRTGDLSANGIYFNPGYYAGGTDNRSCIPFRIYGIKGVK